MRTNSEPPRVSDWLTMRISDMPRNMSASSNQPMPMCPNGTLTDLIFLGLSQPRNRMSWPVDFLRMRRVESGMS